MGAIDMLKQIHVAIVSQNEIEREGLRRILVEQAFEIIGVYRDHQGLDLGPAIANKDVAPIVMVIVDAVSEEESLTTCLPRPGPPATRRSACRPVARLPRW